MLLSTLISVVRGFFREALSLLTWISAFWVSFSFCHEFSLVLQPYISRNGLRITIAIVGLFILTLLAGSMINFIIARLTNKAGLGGLDRLLGLLFGMARGILFTSITLLVAHVIIPSNDKLWDQSMLSSYFVPIETRLLEFVPHDLETQLNRSHSYTQSILAAQNTVSEVSQNVRQVQNVQRKLATQVDASSGV